MKIYAIHDKDNKGLNQLGFLMCYEKSRHYIVELCEDINEWDAPILFQKNVREKNFTITKENARLWVEERVIPSGRQNIGQILREARLKQYNEMALLAMSKGKCAQDNYYLEEIQYEEIPEKIRKRAERNVVECFVTEGQSIICLFADNLVRKISLEKLATTCQDVKHVLKNQALFETVKVGVGGYSISFNDSIEIPVDVLRDEQYEVTFVAEDFRNFIDNNVIDTTKASEMLTCSRQNISYMVKTNKLQPIMKGTKENLFTRGNIERVNSD